MQQRRSNFVINKRLQFSEAAASAALVVLSTNLFLIFGTVYRSSGYISIQLPDTGYLIVGLIEVVLLVGVVFWSLRRSHRFAGPLYAIARDLKRLGEGDLTVRVNLRLGDEFQEEAKVLNEAIESIRKHIEGIKTQTHTMVNTPVDEERQRIADAIKVELERLKTERDAGEE